MISPKFFASLFATMLLSAPGAYSQAADIEAGKAKSVVCAACHGPAGVSMNPEWPNLAGQQDVYLQNQLKNFRAGDRKNALMAPMAAALTDDDIVNLAAYYSSLNK